MKTKLAKAISILIAGTALATASSSASASNTMYNTFSTGGNGLNTSTDGWTHTGGVGNGGEIQPWLGTSGLYADARPFNYIGSAHLNWAVQLSTAGDTAQISAADALARYGATAEIDTGGGAWQDTSTPSTGWKHQTDIGLIESDVTQQVHITLSTLGNQTPSTFSRFGVTLFQGMDTNTGAYSHHGAWNNPLATPPKLFTADNPFGTTGLTNIGYSNNVDAVNDFTFTAYAGQVYSLYLGGVGFSKWNTGVDNYQLNLTTSPVPVPGAVWLFGSALAGFAGFRNRRAVMTA